MSARAAKAGAILLAAGSSRRMGANKLTADLDGRPLILHVAEAIRAAGLPPPIVVTGHDPQAIERALAGRDCRFVHAADHAEGLSRSLAAGIAAVPDDWDAAMICLGDMPSIPAAVLRSLADEAGRERVIVPVHDGRRGNPVIWGRSYFPRLMAIRGDKGARGLIDTLGDAVTFMACDTPAILIDADTPDALAALRANFAKASSSDRRP